MVRYGCPLRSFLFGRNNSNFECCLLGLAKTDNELAILKQIQIDLPRTNPKYNIFQQETVNKMLERVLYVWAVRHPASVSTKEIDSHINFVLISLFKDYVQGINDIATPFFIVFLNDFVGM